jgi:hypothetical protein
MAIPLIAAAIPFLTDLISKYGEKLVVSGVEKVTGIDLGKTELTPEDKQLIIDAEYKIKALDFEKLKLDLESTKETNRHNEKYEELEVNDKQNARGSVHLSTLQTEIANKIYQQSKWLIPLLLLTNMALVMFGAQLELEATALVAIGNLIGIAITNAYRERQSILEFLFGSSVEKK